MELKIFSFSLYLSIFFFVVLTLFLIDEMRPAESQTDLVKEKKLDLEKDINSSLYYFELTTINGRQLNITKAEYSMVQPGDTLKMYVTHWFNEVKGYELSARGHFILSSNYGPEFMRIQVLLASIVGMILSFISFRAKKFELRVSLAFIVFVITAVRWWVLGK